MVALSAETVAVTINLSRLVVVPSATKASFSSYTTQKYGSVSIQYPILFFHTWHIQYGILLMNDDEIQALTLHSSVNLDLSCSWLLDPLGYLQSRFNPSNLFSLNSVIADWMNLCLVCFDDTIVRNLGNI